MIKSIISKILGKSGDNNVKNNKVICGCFNITEEDVKSAINNGAKSFEEVQGVTKLGTGCGRCVGNNRVLVNNLLLQKRIDENQIVCGCFKVTVQDLVSAINNGAKSFEEVQRVTKVGTGCGNCVDSNRILVNELLARQ